MYRDQQIQEIIKENKERGITLLFHKYYLSLVDFSDSILKNRMQAEDLVQEFFISLWRDDYLLKVDNKLLKNYLYRSIRNKTLTQLNCKKECSSEIDSIIYDIAQEVYEEFDSKKVDDLVAYIGQLSPQTQKVIEYIILQDKTYKETASLLEISVNTVKTVLARGMKRIRENYKDKDILVLLFLKNTLSNVTLSLSSRVL